MNSQCEIGARQNEEKLLDCQYSARVLFNRAEKFGYIAVICIVLSAFCIFLQDEISSLIIPLILDGLIILAGYFMQRSQSTAAKIRAYYDSIVLGIKDNDYGESDLRDIFNAVETIVSKHPTEHRLQVQNSGRDYPPGVKNWYEFSKDFSENEAVFECQRQNCWWNNKLCNRRLIITIFAFVAAVIAYFIGINLLKVDFLHSFVCIVGLLIGFSEQIIENCKYISISKTMDDYIRLPDISKSETQIEYLQELINKRRELPVLEVNYLHKKHSKEWSERYEMISRH